jgi:hypothetical protein
MLIPLYEFSINFFNCLFLNGIEVTFNYFYAQVMFLSRSNARAQGVMVTGLWYVKKPYGTSNNLSYVKKTTALIEKTSDPWTHAIINQSDVGPILSQILALSMENGPGNRIAGSWPPLPQRLPKVSHPYMVLPPLAKTSQNQI